MKKDDNSINGRTYLVGGIIFVFLIVIMVKLVYLQQIEGDKYRKKAEDMTLREAEIKATPGNLYSDDGSLLATSVIRYNLRWDSQSHPIIEKKMKDSLRPLGDSLSKMFGKTSSYYQTMLKKAFLLKNRNVFIADNLGYTEYMRIKKFPIFNGKHFRGGLKVDKIVKRRYPLGGIAHRSIGYERKDDSGNVTRVGLEGAYARYLMGTPGRRMEQRIAKGQYKPLSSFNEIEPEDGKDVVSTINTNIQDIAHHALLLQLKKYIRQMVARFPCKKEHGFNLILQILFIIKGVQIMNTNIDLKAFFTMNANIERLKRLPELKTPIMDLVYPNDRRTNYPKSIIAAEDLPKEIKNIPVISRGSEAVIIATKTEIKGFEPFPIEASLRVLASDLNDIVSLGFATQQSHIDQKVERLRRITRATTEALAAQSLSGKIQYALKTAGEDKNVYIIDYGATQTFTPKVKWNTNSVTIAEIITDCLSMTDLVGGTGFGNQTVVLLNASTFAIVIKKVLESKTNILNITVDENAINFPGFTMMRMGSTYYDYQNKKSFPVIPDNKACAIAIDAPHWLPYCAIDDLDANLAPLPFFSKAEKLSNPSAWEIYGKSKPFPVPIVDAICWAEVL